MIISAYPFANFKPASLQSFGGCFGSLEIIDSRASMYNCSSALNCSSGFAVLPSATAFALRFFSSLFFISRITSAFVGMPPFSSASSTTRSRISGFAAIRSASDARALALSPFSEIPAETSFSLLVIEGPSSIELLRVRVVG